MSISLCLHGKYYQNVSSNQSWHTWYWLSANLVEISDGWLNQRISALDCYIWHRMRSYLALHQLVNNEGCFSLAMPILKDNLYVDDCVFRADDKSLALQMRDQLIQLLTTAGFHLRKWTNNCSTLLDDIDPTDHGLVSVKPFSNNENLKILGISWNLSSDSFTFHVCLSSCTLTKRTISVAKAKNVRSIRLGHTS